MGEDSSRKESKSSQTRLKMKRKIGLQFFAERKYSAIGMNTMNLEKTISIGPAGWSYEDWIGSVYPADRRIDRLQLISSLFDCIELNSSFYRIPGRHTVASWADRIADRPGFKFTVKILQRFTHERVADKSEACAFIKAFEPLLKRGAIGAFLMQFPWSFSDTPENRKYIESLGEFFSSLNVAVELRHGSWNNEQAKELCSRLGFAICNIDQPMIGNSMPPGTVVTNPNFGYVRLHGRNCRDWARRDASRDERYNYLYSDRELEEWKDRIESLSNRVKDLYIITNNHFRGQSIVNAFQLKHLIGQKIDFIPQNLIRSYPMLAEIASEKPERDSLF